MWPFPLKEEIYSVFSCISWINCIKFSVEELQRKIENFTEPKQNWLKQIIEKLDTMSASQIYVNKVNKKGNLKPNDTLLLKKPGSKAHR